MDEQASSKADEPYIEMDGIRVPPDGVVHRDEEYSSASFEILRKMQQRHFWYRGRHRFLLYALNRYCGHRDARSDSLRVVDLGGGCGGWIAYLKSQGTIGTKELALADSSLHALQIAESGGRDLLCYQIDLLNLLWSNRWDVAFLLDVLEHIPDDRRAMREIWRSLSPGGLLFVTAPALRCFWSWNDEFAGHQRRYSRSDFKRLADDCGFELLDARYFMFLLSPVLAASRLVTQRRAGILSEEERRRLAEQMHRVPNRLFNGLLSAIFGSETPLGHWLHFPWGTSILGVFRKPESP